MADQLQTFKTHRRTHPLWHYVAFPLLLLNVVASVWHAVRIPTMWNGWGVVVAIAILIAVFAARVQTLTVQNRLIRLEMRMRLRETLPAAMHGRINELSVRQLVGLRFAGDAELPALVDRCLKGELKDDEAVKKEVRDWQADFVRA
jgi:hypothetical protein